MWILSHEQNVSVVTTKRIVVLFESLLSLFSPNFGVWCTYTQSQYYIHSTHTRLHWWCSYWIFACIYFAQTITKTCCHITSAIVQSNNFIAFDRYPTIRTIKLVSLNCYCLAMCSYDWECVCAWSELKWIKNIKFTRTSHNFSHSILANRKNRL